MALIPTTLSTGIVSLLTSMSLRTDDQAGAIQDLADQLATLVDTYIKSATITVATTGTAAAQSGIGIIT